MEIISSDYIFEILIFLGILGIIFIMYKYFSFTYSNISHKINQDKTRSRGFENSAMALTLLKFANIKNISLVILSILYFLDHSVNRIDDIVMINLLFLSLFFDAILFGYLILHRFFESNKISSKEIVSIIAYVLLVFGTMNVESIKIIGNNYVLLLIISPITTIALLIFSFGDSMIKEIHINQSISHLSSATNFVLGMIIVLLVFSGTNTLNSNSTILMIRFFLVLSFLIVLSYWIIGPQGSDMDKESIYYLHRLLPGFLILNMLLSYFSDEFLIETAIPIFVSLIYYERKIYQYLMSDQFIPTIRKRVEQLIDHPITAISK